MQKSLFRRNHRVSEKQLSVLKATFPEWQFEFGEGAPHPHPLGATERAICEELAIRDIMKTCVEPKISDIGGNANRHASCKRDFIHSCNPILSSNDIVRRTNYHPKAIYCDKDSLNCEEIPDAYLSVHSLYYLSPGDIMTLLYKSKQKCLVAVVHRFNNLYGTMHDNGDFVESKYEVSVGEGLRINMSVTGNFTGYEHDPCFWLNNTYYSENHWGKNYAMAWNGYQVGDSWIIRFTPYQGRPILQDSLLVMPLCSSLDRDDHVGTVSGIQNINDEKKLRPMLEMMKVSDMKIHSCMSYLWLRKRGDRHILLPKDFVKTLALFVVGLPRTPATLSLCVSKAKKLVRNLNIPSAMQLDCATYGASLAFVHTLEDEIIAFNKLCDSRLRSLYRAAASALSLENVSFCCFSADNIYETAQAYANDRSSLPAPSFDARKAWPFGLPGTESQMPLREIKKGASISNADREEYDDKPQFHPVAITFSNYIPIVPYASKNNEVVSLNNRALVATPEESWPLWDGIHSHAREIIKDVEPIETMDYDVEFNLWNDRFPDNKRKKRALAWESLKEKELCSEDFVRSNFVKRELTMKGGPDPQDFDPRAIQANTDRVAASYGPFMHQVSKKLAKLWHADAHIYYTSGATAEDVGRWRAKFGDRPVTLLECDQGRYDSCQGRGCYENGAILNEKCGIRNHDFAKLAMPGKKLIRGYSAKGVKYRVPFTMPSGSDDTTVWNSFNNGTTMDKIITDWLIMHDIGIEWWMLVLGDDNFVVFDGVLSRYHMTNLTKYLKRAYFLLGMNAKCKMSNFWHEVEYCSSLFWPVAGGFVLGPKLGKRLPKIGFSLRKLKPEEVKGMILGLKSEAGFIPCFDVYIKNMLKIMAKVQAKEFVDPRKIYKALPTEKHTASADTDIFFVERYGLSVENARKEMELCLLNSVQTSCVNFWCLTHFVAEDL